jgi:predicted nucleotidyltransferase
MQPDCTARLIRLAREDVGMSREVLAAAVRLPTSSIAAYEIGIEAPSPETRGLIVAETEMRPSIPLVVHADEIRAEATRHSLREVRVFGSVARGTDTARSDIDLLVGTRPGADLFDLGGFVAAVEAITGFPVDVLTEEQLDDEYFAHVGKDAVPL